MQSLPTTAKRFLSAIYLAGLGVAAWAGLSHSPIQGQRLWELGLFLALAVLVGSRKVQLIRHPIAANVGSMSLGFAITFAAILRMGPHAGLIVGVVSTLSGCIYPRRQLAHQLLFNVSLNAVETWMAGIVFVWINGDGLDVKSIPAVGASCLAYYAINTGGVATIIGLCGGQRIRKVWTDTFLWTAPSYFAGASISTLACVLFKNQIAPMLIMGAPITYLTYQSYAIYIARAQEKQEHIEELQVSQAHLADLYLATIKSLALAIDAKDQYTHQHILRVQRYAVATAKNMGLNDTDMEGLNTGALLHDIGKLGVPEYVLLKPGRLTDDEFAKIKKHPEIGAAILDPVEFPWPVLPVVKYHHERWDGSGYPEGLKGDKIPLTARILAVGDVYDALTSIRSYRGAWSHDRAIAEIKDGSGSHFDPQVVQAFLEVIDDIVQEMAREGIGSLAMSESHTGTPGSSKADQAARDIQRASSELWALYEVAQTLSTSLGLQETLDILARKLEGLLPGTACLFLLREGDDRHLAVRAAVGLNREFFEGCCPVGSASTTYQVAETGETYHGSYDKDDLLLNGSPTAQWFALEAALIVPIVHQGENLGTINLYHSERFAFGVHDREFLETIAERAAMALYNGVLFDRTRSHAFTDPLTGLHNLRYLTQYVEARCSAYERVEDDPDGKAQTDQITTPADRLRAVSGGREVDRFALLCLDLDSFKPINDNFGHQKGDQVLCDLSRIFKETVRTDDIVARYGGDEFLVVLQNAGAEDAEAMSDRLQAAVAKYDPGLVHPKLGSLHLGVSVGFACFPNDGDDCAALLSSADAHMFGDKTERKLGRLADAVRPEEETADPAVPRAA